MSEKPLFELRHPSGKIWKIYESGNYEGFPDGTWIINYALPLLSMLRYKEKMFDRTLAADKKS